MAKSRGILPLKSVWLENNNSEAGSFGCITTHSAGWDFDDFGYSVPLSE
ncbi:MAG: hypothetical protein ACYSOT_06020 [Planctomycetota bacterium]